MGFITDIYSGKTLHIHDIIVDELDTEKAITILQVKVSDNYRCYIQHHFNI